MEMMRSVGRAVEAGVIVVAVSALLLVGCGGGGGGSVGVNATANAFIAALTDGVGLRTLGASPVVATVTTAAADPAGSYTVTDSQKVLSGSAWLPRTPVVTDYFLSSSGTWIDNTAPSTVTPNADGTITLARDGDKRLMVAVDLSGADINAGASYRLVNPAISGGSAVISVGAVPFIPSTSAAYPAGSVSWISTGRIYSQDSYSVGVNSVFQVKTPAGNLIALNPADAGSYTVSNPLCSGSIRLVYSATQPTSANYARFDVYVTPTCAAIAAGTPLEGTVDLTYKTVRTQSIAQFSNYTGTNYAFLFSMTVAGTVEPLFIAVVNGEVWPGYMIPAGTVEDLWYTVSLPATGLLNKTAMDAVTTAANLPNF